MTSAISGRTVERVVVVGASLAGACVAEGLRARGFLGEVMVVGDDPLPPYERPPLSKAWLVGSVDEQSLMLRTDESWSDLGTTFVLGQRVSRLDVARSAVELSSGEVLDYDRVVLCTGGRGRRLGVPGEDLPGVLQLRDLADATALRPRLVPGARVVVVGGGFIGTEVAATALQLGCEVTIVEASRIPLERVLGERWGPFVIAEHGRRGAIVLTGTGVRSICGRSEVEQVELVDGRIIDADVVVVGIGMVPNTQLAQDAGLAVAGGIVVDDHARTSAPTVLAAGDVTSQPDGAGGRVRRETVQNAQEQGDLAAATILGQVPADRDAPWCWSDQFEQRIQAAGVLADAPEVVVRGDLDGRRFTAFHVRGGRLEGVFAVDSGREFRAAMRLLRDRSIVDATALADPSVDLRRLVAAASHG